MSSKEDMVYLEEEQTLRNKDYVVIKRSEYSRLKELDISHSKREKDYSDRLRKLQNDERLLKSQKKFSQQKEFHIKYSLHKKFKEMTAEILKMNFDENMPSMEDHDETAPN